MQQSLEIIRRRVDETGTREPTIQRQGADRILVQVPGIGSAEELLAVIGQTAQLSFHPVVSRTTVDADGGRGSTRWSIPSLDEPGVAYVLERRAVVTGDQLVDAQPSFDQNGQPAVSFRFNAAGRRGLRRLHRAEHRQPLRHRARRGGDLGAGDPEPHPRRLGHHHRQLHARGVDRLAILLRAGALPAEITVLEQRTVGPELGADSIASGAMAALASPSSASSPSWWRPTGSSASSPRSAW